MGVYVTAAVAEGVRFGPIPTAIALTDPAILIGHMTCDIRPNIHTVKVDIQEYRQLSRLSEWTPYVQAARELKEQNLEAELRDGQLYYRTTRPVNVGDELLVWYSPEYSRLLAIPELPAAHLKDGVYCCPHCSQRFQYPYTLRAHMRFKCEQRHAIYGSRATTCRPVTPPQPPAFKPQLPHAHALFGSMGRCSPTSSVESVESTHSQTERENSPRKRRLSGESLADSGNMKRLRVDERPAETVSSDNESGKIDLNRNVAPRTSVDEDEETGGSAFRKVEKHGTNTSASFQRTVAPPGTSLPGHYEMTAGRPLPAPHFMMKPGAGADDKTLATLASIYNRHPLGLVGPANLAPYIPNWNLLSATSSSDLNRNNASKADTLKSDELSDIHNRENSNPHMTVSAEFGGRISNILPYYRSQNPMVEKIIHSALQGSGNVASISISQNWCAKCNASFRMTSDLVYHMRSHHSPEQDHHLKKKRDEKLKCNVCGETFRERHHLTRHMTSHQDV